MSADQAELELITSTTSTRGRKKMPRRYTRKNASTRPAPGAVPTPDQLEELKRMRKSTGKSFTLPRAQDAMNLKAAKWGAPEDYYTVVEKMGRRYPLELTDGRVVPAHDYVVEVRLFSGRARSRTRVTFILDQNRQVFHAVRDGEGVVTS